MGSAIGLMPEEPERDCFAGAILIGGRSRRMGMDKALLEIDGVPLRQRQCVALTEAGVSEIILSTRLDLRVVIPGIKTVLDAWDDIGPIAGIAAVLQATSCPVVFMLAVDMPCITPRMIQRILSLSNQERGCVPLVHGRHEPLAAAYPRSLLGLVQSQIAAGRHAMHNLIEKAVARGQMSSLEIGDAEVGCFMNCNSPDEWQAFLDRQEH